jgi:hypothetical protein
MGATPRAGRAAPIDLTFHFLLLSGFDEWRRRIAEHCLLFVFD